jgi:hypothetical protein
MKRLKDYGERNERSEREEELHDAQMRTTFY